MVKNQSMLWCYVVLKNFGGPPRTLPLTLFIMYISEDSQTIGG